MGEVLDPSNIFSFLPSDEVGFRAEAVVDGPALRSEVDERNIAGLLERVAPNELQGQAAVRNFLIVHIMTRYCLQAVMDDGQGRSEFHIAGEICRMKKAVDEWAHLKKVPELTKFPEIDTTHNSPSSGNPLWVPEGTIFPCPTIDGKGANEPRIITDKHGRMGFASSMQEVWLGVLTEGMLPSMVGDYLTRLEPRFVLDSGETVDKDTPRYYALINKGGGAEIDIRPRELVGV